MKVVYPAYFPFEFPQASDIGGLSVGPNTPFPVGMSLKDAMTLFWQAKTINCASSSRPDIAGEWRLDSVYGIVISAEDQFVAFNPATDSLVWDNSPETGFASGYLIAFSPWQTGIYAQACVQSGGLYYPNLIFYTYDGSCSLFNFGLNLGEGPLGTATLVINGNSYNIPVKADTSTTPPCDVVLTVDSLWPYDP